MFFYAMSYQVFDFLRPTQHFIAPIPPQKSLNAV